ncbi:transcription factor [Vermiconidia calcicola]|uniref:Transcription factor n=1 Tax=Vermiconidia calcicola TaxID=1690605 RepID=A0ACC3NI45_9PEZI|nr:transcription factor [Vermiconidia calcicola]
MAFLQFQHSIWLNDHARLVECRERAAHHYTLALPAMIRSLPQLNESDTSAVFVGATLLCFHNFAAGPQPGQYIGFSDQGVGEWMQLFRGVRSITESRPDALNDWLRHGNAVDTLQAENRVDAHTRLPSEATHQLARLRRFAARMRAEDETYAKYTVAVESLERCFIDTFSTDPDSSDDIPATQHIFTWLYRIPSEFVVSLQDRRPLALVIFAYFDVLLYQLRDLWYMEGWCEHVMSGIYKHLHVDYRDWLEWPAAVLQWSPPATDFTPGLS